MAWAAGPASASVASRMCVGMASTSTPTTRRPTPRVAESGEARLKALAMGLLIGRPKSARGSRGSGDSGKRGGKDVSCCTRGEEQA